MDDSSCMDFPSLSPSMFDTPFGGIGDGAGDGFGSAPLHAELPLLPLDPGQQALFVASLQQKVNAVSRRGWVVVGGECGSGCVCVCVCERERATNRSILTRYTSRVRSESARVVFGSYIHSLTIVDVRLWSFSLCMAVGARHNIVAVADSTHGRGHRSQKPSGRRLGANGGNTSARCPKPTVVVRRARQWQGAAEAPGGGRGGFVQSDRNGEVARRRANVIGVGRGGSGHCCFSSYFPCFVSCRIYHFLIIISKTFSGSSSFFLLILLILSASMVSCAHTLSYTTRSSITAHHPLDIGSDVPPSLTYQIARCLLAPDSHPRPHLPPFPFPHASPKSDRLPWPLRA